MRHAVHAAFPAHAALRARHARRWRRMRARLGFAALWTALLVWMLGASLRMPAEDAAPGPGVAVRVATPAAAGDPGRIAPAHVDPGHVDLERAAAWPGESGDASPSHEPTPEQDAALYIAGR